MRAAGAVSVAALLFVGCLGQAERTFFDDATQDGGGTDATASQGDATTATGEGGKDGGANASDSGDSAVTEAGVTHKVGGTVIGLTGAGLALRLNGGGDLPVAKLGGGANVPFQFAGGVVEGSSFTVTVKTHPALPTQDCKVIGGTGVMGESDVTSVVINCLTNQYVVGGTLSGLEGNITLHKSASDADGGDVGDGGDSLTLTSNGSFGFLTPLRGGDGYSVAITNHSPLPEQTCAVANGTGTIVNQNIANVGVSCTTNTYTVGGTVTGLTSGTLQLTSANGGTVSLMADGPFTLPTPVLSNRPYNVTVASDPATLTCRVTNPSGTVTTAAIANVSVLCVPRYALVESFDAVAVPSLPAGWTTAVLENTGNPSPFATTGIASGSLTANHTAPNSCAVFEHSNVSDIVLTSPSFTVSSDVAKLSFQHAYNLEASNSAAANYAAYDGAVLELSTDDGASWMDIIAAGGAWDPPRRDPITNNLNAAYTGYSYVNEVARIIPSAFLNPLATRAAWSGASGGWKLTTVKLPLAAGTPARIRFRLGTDKQVAVNGWRVDSIAIAN